MSESQFRSLDFSAMLEMMRRCVRLDRITSWSVDKAVGAPYPLELFQRVITVSLETMKVVRALPTLEID